MMHTEQIPTKCDHCGKRLKERRKPSIDFQKAEYGQDSLHLCVQCERNRLESTRLDSWVGDAEGIKRVLSGTILDAEQGGLMLG